MELTRLHILKTSVPLLLAAVVIACAGMWLTGCDFNPAEQEEIGAATQDVLAALAAAETEADAENAIQALVEKTGLDGTSGASMYRPFGLEREGRASLAKRLAAYNRGELSSEISFAAVYGDARPTENAVTADVDETMRVFRAVVADALRNPEDPNAAFIVATATHLPRLPESASAVNHTADASPLQAELFSAWLSKHGPLMDVYAGKRTAPAGLLAAACDVDETCPGDTPMARICHAPGTPDQETRCVSLATLDTHIEHGDACGVCGDPPHDQGGTD